MTTTSETSGVRLELKRQGSKIWSHVRQIWLEETPEERVRQEYLLVLVNEYGFSLKQIAEELNTTGRGTGQARADFLVWRTPQDKLDNKNPLIAVECKSDNVTITQDDYWQGDNYARYTGARFLVTHNNSETKYWRVLHEKMPKSLEEISDIPHADDSDKEIEALLKKLKVFKENEFADLLHKCHNIIRNREKLDPAAAFDEIAKILFVKVTHERRLRAGRVRENLFTAAFLDKQKVFMDNPVDVLFNQTKAEYKADKIFESDETITLKFNTVREIVRELERYDLSETSEDVKGIAFERFLGRTFRGEIGQFFTPRSIVEFMIRMVEPKEREIICDPASGSGGFLIRFFEIVRQQILAETDQDYQSYKAEVEATTSLTKEEKAAQLDARYKELQTTLDQSIKGSKLWTLANRCIYGTDANERMARTSKMNMIMHGDGHGGVHHHDGFLNVNGIFEGRFDIILTNPPFGASVEASDVVHLPPVDEETEARYRRDYGALYEEAQRRVRAQEGKPISSLFALPKGEKSKIKTEILFIERCLDLLKPGGRLGIVLPEGIFNNPSLAYVREFCEDRAYIQAVVSLPQETFYASGATVKASLLFLQKFTEEQKADFEAKREAARAEVEAKYAPEIAKETARLETLSQTAKTAATQAQTKLRKLRKTEAPDEVEVQSLETLILAEQTRRKDTQRELLEYQRRMDEQKKQETRALLRERFAYPVFLYEADKVGITATGEADQNELYSNETTELPEGVTPETTCLALYQQFKKDAAAFMLGAAQ